MEDIYRSQFRLPHSLYESLKKSAGSNRRSINAELVARLEETFEIEETLEEVASGDHKNPAVIRHHEIDERLDLSNARLCAIEQQIKQMLEILTRK